MSGFLLFFIAHLLIGLIAKQVAGLDITVTQNGLDNWNVYWQTLHASDLTTHLLPSIWTLHSQPPLFNLYGAFFINLFPDSSMQALHYSNILLGALICGLSFRTLHLLTRSTWIAVLGALLVTLNPALPILEAYPLYTMLALFFITLSLFFLARYQRYKQTRDLFGFILAVNLLVLTRSIYHPLFLLPCIALAIWLGWDQRWRVLRITLLISLLSFGWATKNALQYGFWGTSSWTGLNLWHIVSHRYREAQLDDFALAGVIPQMVAEKGAFSYPGAYRVDGFDKDSDLPSLARNEYNNINIPDIAQVYQRSALAVMQYDPAHYLRNVAMAYQLYSCPSTRFPHTQPNADKLRGWVDFYENVLYGAAFWNARGITLLGQQGGCSIWYVDLPLSVIAFGLLSLIVTGLSARRWWHFLREEPVLLMMALFIVFNTAVSIAGDIDENVRFKFLIEPMWWFFVLTMVQRAVLLAQDRYPTWTVPEPQPAAPVLDQPVPAAPTPAPEPVPVTNATVTISPRPKRRIALLGLLLSAVAAGGVAVWWRQRTSTGRF